MTAFLPLMGGVAALGPFTGPAWAEAAANTLLGNGRVGQVGAGPTVGSARLAMYMHSWSIHACGAGWSGLPRDAPARRIRAFFAGWSAPWRRLPLAALQLHPLRAIDAQSSLKPQRLEQTCHLPSLPRPLLHAQVLTAWTMLSVPRSPTMQLCAVLAIFCFYRCSYHFEAWRAGSFRRPPDKDETPSRRSARIAVQRMLYRPRGTAMWNVFVFVGGFGKLLEQLAWIIGWPG